jgi:hypothetical protein
MERVFVMKKRILSIALSLALMMVPMAAVAQAQNNPVYIDGVTVEVPGIPDMTITMDRVWENYFYRESDGSVMFVVTWFTTFVFDRDITLSVIDTIAYPNELYPHDEPLEGYGIIPLFIEKGVPFTAENGRYYFHSFTIDGVTVLLVSKPHDGPDEVFFHGTFLGERYNTGLINEWTDMGFTLRPMSSIAVGGIAPSAPDLTTAGSWAHEGITAAIESGFVPAEIQGSYKTVITRQEFCRMAVKWLEVRTGESIDGILAKQGLTLDPSAFTDTSDPYILAAYALGITGGTRAPAAGTPGLFTPDGAFSREQAATMIMNTVRALDKFYGWEIFTAKPPASDFTDLNTAASWAHDGINFVRANGIMGGTSATAPVFSPKETYTREQSIVTFNNIAFG